MKTETFVPLQTRPTWRTEARLVPNASESAAAGLGGPSGCFLPRLSQPRRGGGFPSTHTRSQRGWGSGGAATAPRYPHAGPARRGGTALPTRPPPALDVGAPAPTLGPRPSALAPPPRLHAPLADPLRAPQGSGQPGCLGQPRERPQSKKEQREGEGGAEARVLRTRLEVGLGGTLRALGRLRGSRAAFRLTPRSRLPFPPLPGPPAPFLCSSFLLPSGPLRSGAGLSPGD